MHSRLTDLSWRPIGIKSKRRLKPRKKTRSREQQKIKPTKHKRHKRPTSISVRPECDMCGAKIATYRLLIYHKNRKHNVPYSVSTYILVLSVTGPPGALSFDVKPEIAQEKSL